MATTIAANSMPLIADGDRNGNITVGNNSTVVMGIQVYMTDSKNPLGIAYKVVGINAINGQVTLADPSGKPVSTSRWLLKNQAVLNWTAQTLAGVVAKSGMVSKVIHDFLVLPPTAASTQATGAVAAVVNVNLDAGVCSFAGLLGETQAAQTSLNLTSPPVLTIGQSVIASIYLYLVGTTVTVLAVWGTPATTGQQVAPDRVAVAAANPTKLLVLLANTTINRTGNTTVTQVTDNTVRDF